MKEQVDYYFISKITINDILNTGRTIKGFAYLTKKYLFVMPERVEDMGGVIGKMCFDLPKFKELLTKINEVEPGLFEISMMEIVPPEYVMPLSNFDKFEVNVGFFIFGGLSFKVKGKKLQSATIGSAKIRQQVKDFISDIKFQ
ncbi:MAG: hypothetical protein KBB11_03320 [Bacteroidales bacterium]|nr:hypothetical protein [Bacteroidales bacterium]HOY40170.1 hypothetical protein [Bacteroidales bacterium]HQP04716.1 hypothetical protein [Bacteroidales bacterium]